MPKTTKNSKVARAAAANPADYLTRQHVYQYFDQTTAARALEYQRENRIFDTGLSLRDDAVTLSGGVRGKRKYEVFVKLRLDRNSNPIEITKCSCPVAFDCKHAAALLFDYIEYSEERQKYRGLDSRVAAWLSDIKAATDALADAEQPAGAVASKCVLYIVDQRLERNLSLLSVRPHTASRKKSGAFGATRTHFFSELARSRGQFLQPDDVKLLQMYAMTTRFSMFGEQLPDDPAVVELLISMTLATNRCHWQNANNPPLKMGREKKASLGWRLTNENGHIPELEVQDERNIPLFSSFPLYVDTGRWEIGPLRLDVPWKVAHSFLAGPAIKPQELEKVTEILLPFTSSAKIPLPPRKLELLKITGKPKPRLSLHTVKEALGKMLPRPQHYAVLRFEYDGITVNGRNPSAEIKSRDGERLTCVVRDLEEEQQIITRLTESGLKTLVSVALPFASDELVFKAGESNSDRDWLRWLELDLNFPIEREDDLVVFDLGMGGKTKAHPKTALHLEKTASWWFNLHLGINVDGQNISLLPILKQCFKQFDGPVPPETIERLAVNGTFYLKLPGGAYVGLPVQQVKDIYGTLLEMFINPGIDDEQLDKFACSATQALALMQAPSMSNAEVECDEGSLKFLEKLKAFSNLGDFKRPPGFMAQLRPYQEHGCAWLQFLADHELGGILADDMGLGKTVQVLAHLLAEKESGRAKGPSLVICPTSVGPNWMAEAARHAPTLTSALLTNGHQILASACLQDRDLLITSYGLIQRHHQELSKYSWHAVVLDEAQFIKNYKASAARAVSSLNAHHRLCLTGTPIENHLGDLWSQFNFAMPGFLGDSKRFKRDFQIPIEKYKDSQTRERLISRIKSFVLRRTKDQVIKDLPAKTVIVKTVELEGGQRELYEVVRLAAFQKVRDEVAARGLQRSQITILAELMKLRQVCCDPRLPKVNSPYKEQAPSMKLAFLMQMIEKLHEEGRHILVFSQFTSMLDLIEDELNARAIDFVTLRGETRDRATPVNRFQNGEVSVFLLSLRAGGTGLNLTAADTVIHYDLWWNPAVESQATDRAHRIGQTKPVFVYKLIARGTIEQRMIELQAKKNSLAQAILNDDTKLLSRFSEADINALFDPIDVEYTADLDF